MDSAWMPKYLTGKAPPNKTITGIRENRIILILMRESCKAYSSTYDRWNSYESNWSSGDYDSWDSSDTDWDLDW